MHARKLTPLFILALGFCLWALAMAETANAARGTGIPASRDEVRRMVIAEAQGADVPVALALAVAKVESNFNPRALSSAGARGVMQIMPKTGRDLYGVEPDQLWDAELNIRLGIDFLKNLHKRYGRWDLALSHYNGGSAVGTPPNARVIPATRKYVDAVLAWHRRFERDATVVALADAKEDRDAVAAPAPRSAYWSYDRPNVDQGWRHYLQVADRYLDRSRRMMNGESVDPVGPSIDPEPADQAAAGTASPNVDPYANVDPWADTPATTAAAEPVPTYGGDVRQRFRSYLSTGRLPFQTRLGRSGGGSRFGG